MNKKSIDKYISTLNEIEQKVIEAKRNIQFLGTMKLSDYSNPVDKEQARESMEYTESEILWALFEISKDSRELIKKIDPEALKEFEDA